MLSTNPRPSISILLARDVFQHLLLLGTLTQVYQAGEIPCHTRTIWVVPIRPTILIQPQTRVGSKVQVFLPLHLNSFPIIISLQHPSVERVPVPSTPRRLSIADRGADVKLSRIITLFDTIIIHVHSMDDPRVVVGRFITPAILNPRPPNNL